MGGSLVSTPYWIMRSTSGRSSRGEPKQRGVIRPLRRLWDGRKRDAPLPRQPRLHIREPESVEVIGEKSLVRPTTACLMLTAGWAAGGMESPPLGKREGVVDIGHEDGGAVRHWALRVFDDGPIRGHKPLGNVPRVKPGTHAGRFTGRGFMQGFVGMPPQSLQRDVDARLKALLHRRPELTPHIGKQVLPNRWYEACRS